MAYDPVRLGHNNEEPRSVDVPLSLGLGLFSIF
jgi:hypothetical protein